MILVARRQSLSTHELMDSSAMSEMRKPHNSNRVAAHVICNEEYKTVGSCHLLDYNIGTRYRFRYLCETGPRIYW